MKLKKSKCKAVLIVIFMLAMTFVIMFSGCTKLNTDDVKEKLKEKYSEEFVVIRTTVSNEKSGKFLTAICHPSSDSELCFEAVLNETTGDFSDKYSEAILGSEMKKEMRKHLDSVAEEFEIVIDMESFAPDYERGTSPKEYNDGNKCVFYAIVAINKDKTHTSDSDELYGALGKMLESIGKCDGGIGVYFTDTQTLAGIKDHAANYPEIGSTILDMCGEGFSSGITDGRLEKSSEELKTALY